LGHEFDTRYCGADPISRLDGLTQALETQNKFYVAESTAVIAGREDRAAEAREEAQPEAEPVPEPPPYIMGVALFSVLALTALPRRPRRHSGCGQS
jgi:hypothetical protein